MKTAVSLRRLIVPSSAMYMAPTGLVIPAWKRGFCRRIAASSVDPERGSPEMKCIPLSIKAPADDEIPAPVVSCGPVGGNRASIGVPHVPGARNPRRGMHRRAVGRPGPHDRSIEPGAARQGTASLAARHRRIDREHREFPAHLETPNVMKDTIGIFYGRDRNVIDVVRCRIEPANFPTGASPVSAPVSARWLQTCEHPL